MPAWLSDGANCFSSATGDFSSLAFSSFLHLKMVVASDRSFFWIPLRTVVGINGLHDIGPLHGCEAQVLDDGQCLA